MTGGGGSVIPGSLPVEGNGKTPPCWLWTRTGPGARNVGVFGSWKRQGTNSPLEPREGQLGPTLTQGKPSGNQDCEITSLCCLRPPGLWQWPQQPQEHPMSVSRAPTRGWSAELRAPWGTAGCSQHVSIQMPISRPGLCLWPCGGAADTGKQARQVQMGWGEQQWGRAWRQGSPSIPGLLGRTKVRGTLGKSFSWTANCQCKGPEAGATWQGLEGAWVFMLSKKKWVQV